MKLEQRAAQMKSESQKNSKAPHNMNVVTGGPKSSAESQMAKMEGPMCSTFRGPLKGGC